MGRLIVQGIGLNDEWRLTENLDYAHPLYCCYIRIVHLSIVNSVTGSVVINMNRDVYISHLTTTGCHV